MKIKYKFFLSAIVLVAFSASMIALASNRSLQVLSVGEPSLGVELMRRESVEQMILRFADSVDNNLCYSVNSVIRKVYSTDDILWTAFGHPNGELSTSSIAPRTLSEVNRRRKLEFVERVNDELIYAAFKVKNGDIEYYKYLFFMLYDKSNPNNQESWVLSGRAFTISQPLSFADFGNIKIGSTLSDVSEIDPLASVRATNFRPLTKQAWDFTVGTYVEKIITDPGVFEYVDFFYLTDGILRISFSWSNNPNFDFVVTDIEFNSEFNIKVDQFNKSVDVLWDSGHPRIRETEMQFKIHPKDFPDGLTHSEL